jgi:hypothetical protein
MKRKTQRDVQPMETRALLHGLGRILHKLKIPQTKRDAQPMETRALLHGLGRSLHKLKILQTKKYAKQLVRQLSLSHKPPTTPLLKKSSERDVLQ